MSLLGWWKPKCPVDFREKGWVETRLRWLGEQFGMNRLSRCQVILPPEMRFPETFDKTPEAVRRLLDQVCRCMEVNPSQVELKIEPRDAMIGRAGEYGSGVIHVVETQLENPVALTATLAHEVAHHILIGRKLLDGDADMEWTTDLAPVIFGLGIFAANATIHELHERTGRWSRWSVVRHGYLPARMLGYAMALHAWLCDQRTPDWTECLRHDAADAFEKGLDYLRSTEDALLRPDNLHGRNPNPSMRQLLDALDRGTATESVVTLWELARRGSEAGEAAPAVARRLTNRRPGLRAEAARTLARLGPAAETAIPALLDALNDYEIEVRACAAYALGRLHARPETVVVELIERLHDPETIETVAWALAQFGIAAASALPRLLAVLKDALGRGDEATDYLAYAVRAISSAPEDEIRQLVASCDIELRRQIKGVLPEADGSIPIPPGGRDWWFWPGRPT